MKRTLMIAGVIGALMAGGVGSWHGGQKAPDTESCVDGVVGDITSQAADQLKTVFAMKSQHFSRVMTCQKHLVLTGMDRPGSRSRSGPTSIITVWMSKNSVRRKRRWIRFFKMRMDSRRRRYRIRSDRFLGNDVPGMLWR